MCVFRSWDSESRARPDGCVSYSVKTWERRAVVGEQRKRAVNRMRSESWKPLQCEIHLLLRLSICPAPNATTNPSMLELMVVPSFSLATPPPPPSVCTAVHCCSFEWDCRPPADLGAFHLDEFVLGGGQSRTDSGAPTEPRWSWQSRTAGARTNHQTQPSPCL